MTSVEWVYEPEDADLRQERYNAMDYADKVARRVVYLGNHVLTPLQREALAIRRAELTFADIRTDAQPVQIVKVQLGNVIGGVLLANLILSVIVSILWAMAH